MKVLIEVAVEAEVVDTDDGDNFDYGYEIRLTGKGEVYQFITERGFADRIEALAAMNKWIKENL